MKKILSIILITAFFVSVLTACSGGLSDEEVRAILEEKLPTSYYVMAAIYGDLLKVENPEKIDPSWTTAQYFKVTKDSKYTSMDAMIRDAEKVFSKNYLLTVYKYAFPPEKVLEVLGDEFKNIYSETDSDGLPRFFEDKETGELKMDVVAKKPYGIMTDLYIDTAEVIKSTRYMAEIKIDGSADGGKTVRSVRLTLACVDGEWLFSGPTY